MDDVEPTSTNDLTVAWGRSVLEPSCGHIREMQDGQPVICDLGGEQVGMAICGALLIDDLAPEVAAGDFNRCSACLDLLDDIHPADQQ